MSEELLQRVLAAPVVPEFPARVGVVVLDNPFSKRAYSRLSPGDEAPQRLARALENSRHFELVSDISPHLAQGQHIESLRELAARYRLKYLIVLTRQYVDRSRFNSWGWGWLTVLGIPWMPAYTLDSAMIAEATLMEVQSGTFLFTSQVHVEGTDRTTPFGTERKLGSLQHEMSRRAVRRLAPLFVAKCNRLVAAARRGVKKTALAHRSVRDKTVAAEAPSSTGEK